jgi:hypothetical protein
VTHGTRSLIVGAVLLLSSAAFAPRPATRHLSVTLSGSTVSPRINQIREGKVAISVVNRGKVAAHELLLVTDTGRVIGRVARSKTFTLNAGGYALFANRSTAGPRAKLIVRGPP